METGFLAVALAAALALLCACRGDAAVNEAAPAAAPATVDLGGAAAPQGTSLPLIWNGAARLNILCIVSGSADNEAIRSDLCARIRAKAAAGAPLPVVTIQPGDPAVIDAANVALLVHAAADGEGAARQLAFSIRPYRAGGAETDILFGSAPRAVPMSRSGAVAAALDAALDAALAETLPWLSRPVGDRPI
jgi:hypothetical protein